MRPAALLIAALCFVVGCNEFTTESPLLIVKAGQPAYTPFEISLEHSEYFTLREFKRNPDPGLLVRIQRSAPHAWDIEYLSSDGDRQRFNAVRCALLDAERETFVLQLADSDADAGEAHCLYFVVAKIGRGYQLRGWTIEGLRAIASDPRLAPLQPHTHLEQRGQAVSLHIDQAALDQHRAAVLAVIVDHARQATLPLNMLAWPIADRTEAEKQWAQWQAVGEADR